jgi:hypothetical protein
VQENDIPAACVAALKSARNDTSSSQASRLRNFEFDPGVSTANSPRIQNS